MDFFYLKCTLSTVHSAQYTPTKFAVNCVREKPLKCPPTP